jgi:hypothetical protein
MLIHEAIKLKMVLERLRVTELRKLATIIIDDIPNDEELAAMIFFLVINC